MTSKAPNKATQAALRELVEALTTPALPKGFGAPDTLPELLRWMHQRQVKIHAADPRRGDVRALFITAERVDEALKKALEALGDGD